uniref:SET domain-containing protein n=1 Tax=Musa acuminata subsp. malaccensis TaxID=214687 RepID=A0A804HVZ5_MUSAM|nr:PREDICTED: protein PLASTID TRANSCRIPTIONALLY ACTIVE 14 isoform X4 [Musa acuminata subsp. malaccensis]
MFSSPILPLPPLPSPSFLSHRTQLKNGDNAFFVPLGNNSSTSSRKGRRRVVTVSRASTAPVLPFKFFEPPKAEESSLLSELEPADPDFYKIGYVRSMRAYGVEFMEGPNGFGVYASKDVEPLRRARVIMEIPLELMLTISQKLPWMFFPDIIPVGHPIFDIINSTKPETDWDLRLACLLLYSFDVEGNFWQLYGDFLPSPEECTSLLLAHKDDLLELQDTDLASKMEEQQKRAIEFWEKHWPNCFLHWRFKDRMLEVMINAGQRIKKGEEMTINYMSGQKNNIYMERYGFSSPTNPWDVINFSSNAKIHLDSYLSVFNISGLPEEFYHNSLLSSEEDNKFVDGAVIAAARTLPTWSDGDVPPVPSTERRSARELQEDCYRLLLEFPTTLEQDWQILDSNPDASRTCEAAIKYRLHRKLFLKKVIQALELYQERILF